TAIAPIRCSMIGSEGSTRVPNKRNFGLLWGGRLTRFGSMPGDQEETIRLARRVPSPTERFLGFYMRWRAIAYDRRVRSIDFLFSLVDPRPCARRCAIKFCCRW